jgi:hypothetical protein
MRTLINTRVSAKEFANFFPNLYFYFDEKRTKAKMSGSQMGQARRRGRIYFLSDKRIALVACPDFCCLFQPPVTMVSVSP